MIPTLALSPYLVTGLVVVFLLVCIAMILLILIQRPQGGGLSGAFGAGGGAGQTAFGTKTGDVLTLVTIAIFILFLVTAIVLNFAARPSSAPPPGTAIRELGEDAPVVGDEPVGEEPPEQNSDAPVNDLIQPEDQTTTEDAPSGDEDGGTP